MVWKPGSKHSVSSSRVIARRNDWNSIRDLHQGPRSMAASRGRIHDRSPISLPKHQKALADRGPSIHDEDAGTLAYLADTAVQAGLATTTIDMEDIGWRDEGSGFVDLDNRDIDLVF